MWGGGLGYRMNPATSQGGAVPLPPPGCHFGSAPLSQLAGNLLLHRKIQEAPDSSFPLGFPSWEEAELWQAGSSLPGKAVTVAGRALSPLPPLSPCMESYFKSHLWLLF